MNPFAGLMAPMVDRPCMTRATAVAIRERQVNGGNVSALELQEAVQTLEKKRPGRPYKFQLPELSRPVREQMNAALCFNLGRAIKAQQETKAEAVLFDGTAPGGDLQVSGV